MGICRQMAETAREYLIKDKERRQSEVDFIYRHKGSAVICKYIANLFEKGNPCYNWLKENRVGLFPVINADSISLCYMQPGDGQSFKGMIPKDIEVAKYTFKEIYVRSGYDEAYGYAMLYSRTMLNALEEMLRNEISKLPHLKYNVGYLVKMFQ